MKHSAILLVVLFFSLSTFADTGKMINFSFKNKEITEIVESYAKESGRKFVLDPSVRGKSTIHTTGKVTIAEAFNLLSDALATNGFAISDRDDTAVILNARDVQRSLISVSTELPTLKPERMVTYVYTLKNAKAETIIKEMRMLTSKNGEMYPSNSNKLVITDFTSNMQRIHNLLMAVDQK